MSQIAWMVKRVKNQHLEAREIEFLEFDNQESNYWGQKCRKIDILYSDVECLWNKFLFVLFCPSLFEETYLAKKSREHVL